MAKKETSGMRISGSRSEAIQVVKILRQREALKDAAITKEEFIKKKEGNTRRDIR